ncbi:hypothetical protein MMC29_005120 [Sticta canariensis]|nr:hypothetical protein [Sticta canariensis]
MTEPSDQSVANSTTSESERAIDEIPENQAVTNNVTSTRSPLGLLDLPPEIRVTIFRHVLVQPHGICFDTFRFSPSVGILRTNRLIHREAFDVLYGENRLNNCLGPSLYFAASYPRILNTIQRVHFKIPIIFDFRHSMFRRVLDCMHYFGNPSMIRSTLTVAFGLDGTLARHRKRFIKALGRFTNFRIVELRFYQYSQNSSDRFFDAVKHHEHALEPVFGFAEHRDSEGFNTVSSVLVFHPIDHQNRLRELADDDWADSLDGIRLEWNEDAYGVEIPAQN